LFRAAAAVLITINLLQAIQVVEKERQQQLESAQTARLEALQQIQRDLEEREVLRQELLRHTVIAQEEERARIARELHDETAQFLTALDLNLATLRSYITPNPKSMELISWIQDLTRDMSRGIYRLVRDLRPAQLDDLGLIPALQLLIDEQRAQTGLNIGLSISGQQSRLDHLVETVFFRIAQEALTNVARHARCQQAFVNLNFSEEGVSMRIQDNGIGLGTKLGDPPPNGWGLEGMRERAESVGGTLQVYSPPTGGTMVECYIPFPSSSKPKE
jgi:two-component system sensor histidine kinase UhpB